VAKCESNPATVDHPGINEPGSYFSGGVKPCASNPEFRESQVARHADTAKTKRSAAAGVSLSGGDRRLRSVTVSEAVDVG